MPDFDTAPVPIATYRLQLRGGMDLDGARALLPWLKDLGVSHLYLAPPFRAASGSTHGYDVIDPTCIDPVLGGQDAFERLSDAARHAGIGIVVDIVPNHMGFTPENPWLADVMRAGQNSRHAPVFDIDWSKGRLHFPVLDGAPADLLAAGDIAMSGNAKDPMLRVYERDFPLRITDLATHLVANPDALDAPALQTLLDEQHWSLGHWRDDADRIIHRRFFNITDLIGVRQEDPAVFDLTHAWIIAQVAAGRIQGLRVDHIDGLAQPGAYLDRLRAAVGSTPIWIEKIVKVGELIPATWPIEGMSGYEFMGPVTRLLTDPEGLAAMRSAAHGAVPASTSDAIRAVRIEMLANVFTPEVARVTEAAMRALDASEIERSALSAAVTQLAAHWPVYRSYAADMCPLDPGILDAVAKADGETHAHALLRVLAAPAAAPARAFAARFEQLTGALTAKSEEDTVFFRSVAYLPFCEVGAEPDLNAETVSWCETQMATRAAQTPLALNALSTHDTKRSADARAILIALTRFPDLAGTLYAQARSRAAERGLPERWGLYALQTALMLRGEPDAQARIADHVAKAMREAKDLSFHESPNEEAESRVAELCEGLMRAFDRGLLAQAEARQLDEAIAAVVLAQVALQLTAPGIPDIYQGTEALAVALTDPDNRRAVDWQALRSLTGEDSLSARKLALTRALLAERRAAPRLLTHGAYRLARRDGALVVERELDGQRFSWTIGLAA